MKVDLNLSYKREDFEIAQAVLASLKNNFFVPHEQIKVVVEDGFVTLDGEVKYYYQKEYAKTAVQYLYGVKNVNNNIIVKSDVTIRASEVKDKIVREFERNARIDASNIKVDVEGSKVTLSGRVKNIDEDREAKRAVWSVPGVSRIVDNLAIA